MTKSEQIEEEDITGITVSGGFGHNTRQPFVQMLIPRADWMTQMSPATARELAHNLLACADAAESDGFLVGFLQNVIGVDDMSKVAGVLVQFREYREEQLRKADQ
ncbi:MAG: hypothetical protein E6Q97_14120 [Desulfurellales bacterium]|nr:MAG: hypothetical protein E6Q97_14120 [Desulfurellales bacterium]